MKSATTQLFKFEIVEDVKRDMFLTLASTYVGLGRPIRWGNAAEPEEVDEIEEVVDSVDYANQVFRDMIAMKRLEAQDVALVIPRVDWLANTVYHQYSNKLPLFSFVDQLSIGTIDATSNVATQNSAIFSGNVTTGNIIMIGLETKEIVAVDANTITLNTALTGTYSNTMAIRISNTYPTYANTFYVRNSKDQIFKCLFNNYGAMSTIEPTIDIDGQLPENPYILTGDNYKWKYMYTIPYGLKQKFFTKYWMPVISDNAVVAGSVDGRIDTINILDGGSGYFLNNGESGNSASLFIITATGDGESASITAKVESGVITELNILNGGVGYTNAIITVNDPDQLANGNVAILEAVISPNGGHGSFPDKELGCFSIMLSVDFVGTESDTLPVGSTVTPFDFRQICLIRDPYLTTGVAANASIYRTTTKLSLTDPGITNYLNDESVYIGSDLASANMKAVVVDWQPNSNELFVNNLSGNVIIGSTLTGQTSAAGTTILGIQESDIKLFSGDMLYVENRSKIVRDVDQTEQIRLVLSF